jgi:hypothetical protein
MLEKISGRKSAGGLCQTEPTDYREKESIRRLSKTRLKLKHSARMLQYLFSIDCAADEMRLKDCV